MLPSEGPVCGIPSSSSIHTACSAVRIAAASGCAREARLFESSEVDLEPAQFIDRYKSLADIERGFRVLKSEIEIALVFHRLPERIRAHASICFMALILYRVMPRAAAMRGRADPASVQPDLAVIVSTKWHQGADLPREGPPTDVTLRRPARKPGPCHIQALPTCGFLASHLVTPVPETTTVPPPEGGHTKMRYLYAARRLAKGVIGGAGGLRVVHGRRTRRVARGGRGRCRPCLRRRRDIGAAHPTGSGDPRRVGDA